jgi:hypothetical protein
MTEREWLDCKDSTLMLQFLQGKASDRKLRLFACACGRYVWHLFPDERCRRAIEVGEQYADGLVGEWIREALWREIYDLKVEAVAEADFDRAAWLRDREAPVYDNVSRRATYTPASPRCDFLREIIGNPFRPITLNRTWLSWNGRTIPKLAQAIYDERAFERLPILADALEEAGCTSAEILDHCRQPGKHVRGCWVVDAVLGKS